MDEIALTDEYKAEIEACLHCEKPPNACNYCEGPKPERDTFRLDERTKEEAIRLVISGKSKKAVAKEIGVAYKTIFNWMKGANRNVSDAESETEKNHSRGD